MKIAIALMLILTAAMAYGAETKYLTYDEFIRQVDEGQVKSVTLDHLSQIRGTYMVDGEEIPKLKIISLNC